jgi:hypothetical protein
MAETAETAVPEAPAETAEMAEMEGTANQMLMAEPGDSEGKAVGGATVEMGETQATSISTFLLPLASAQMSRLCSVVEQEDALAMAALAALAGAGGGEADLVGRLPLAGTLAPPVLEVMMAGMGLWGR